MFNEPKRVSAYRARYVVASENGMYFTIVRADGVYGSFYDGKTATEPEYLGQGAGIVVDGALKKAEA